MAAAAATKALAEYVEERSLPKDYLSSSIFNMLPFRKCFIKWIFPPGKKAFRTGWNGTLTMWWRRHLSRSWRGLRDNNLHSAFLLPVTIARFRSEAITNSGNPHTPRHPVSSKLDAITIASYVRTHIHTYIRTQTKRFTFFYFKAKTP